MDGTRWSSLLVFSAFFRKLPLLILPLVGLYYCSLYTYIPAITCIIICACVHRYQRDVLPHADQPLQQRLPALDAGQRLRRLDRVTAARCRHKRYHPRRRPLRRHAASSAPSYHAPPWRPGAGSTLPPTGWWCRPDYEVDVRRSSDDVRRWRHGRRWRSDQQQRQAAPIADELHDVADGRAREGVPVRTLSGRVRPRVPSSPTRPRRVPDTGTSINQSMTITRIQVYDYIGILYYYIGIRLYRYTIIMRILIFFLWTKKIFFQYPKGYSTKCKNEICYVEWLHCFAHNTNRILPLHETRCNIELHGLATITCMCGSYIIIIIVTLY